MKKYLLQTIILSSILLFVSCAKEPSPASQVSSNDLMVRMAVIEVDPDYLDQYLEILRKEAEASVRIEPGVISIFPMYQNEKPNEIKLLEIYADKKAYESHLQTPHFKHYKSATLHMVTSLELIEMEALDQETMKIIFKKIPVEMAGELGLVGR